MHGQANTTYVISFHIQIGQNSAQLVPKTFYSQLPVHTHQDGNTPVTKASANIPPAAAKYSATQSQEHVLFSES